MRELEIDAAVDVTVVEASVAVIMSVEDVIAKGDCEEIRVAVEELVVGLFD